MGNRFIKSQNRGRIRTTTRYPFGAAINPRIAVYKFLAAVKIRRKFPLFCPTSYYFSFLVLFFLVRMLKIDTFFGRVRSCISSLYSALEELLRCRNISSISIYTATSCPRFRFFSPSDNKCLGSVVSTNQRMSSLCGKNCLVNST